MSNIMTLRFLKLGKLSSFSRAFNTTPFRLYPRGAKPIPDENHEKWSGYVSDRREYFTPLHKEYGTTFGSVRFDKDNEPEYTGQLDDIEEALLKTSYNEDDLNEMSQNLGSFHLEGNPKVSTKLSQADFESPGTGLFVEDIVNLKPIRVLEIHKKDNPKPKVKDGSTSKASHGEKVNSNTLNEIDSQYFSSLEDFSSLKTVSSETDVDQSFNKENLTAVHSNLVSEDKDDLNYFDQQLLGEAPKYPEQNDYSSDDLLNPKNLEDLNYFDKQMIFGEPEAKIHPDLQNDTPIKIRNEELESKKGRNKPQTEVSLESDDVYAKPKVKSFKPVKGSALEFVKKLRQKSLENPTPDRRASKSREQLVSEIGVSMEKRILNASNMKKSLVSKKEFIEEDGSENNVSGKLNPSFIPEDLSKLTSVEVERIFANSVIYDENDVVAIFKPYGVPMFGDSKLVSHSVEKYLDAICNATKAEKLFEVHRLDKTTCGILLFAKTLETHEKLKRLFRERKIVKTYWALVNGTPSPSEGIINIPLQEQYFSDNRYRINLCPDLRGNGLKKAKISRHFKNSDVMPAVTSFRTLAVRGNASLVEVKPTTGFKHQIRSHLGLGLGCPVLGDHKYSYTDSMGKPQKVHGDILNRLGVRFSKSRDLPIYLIAKKIRIPEIISDRNLVIEAKLPHYFNRTMKRLKLQPPKKS